MASSIANCFCLKSMPLNKDWNHSQRSTIVRNTSTKELHFLHKDIQNDMDITTNDFCWEHWNSSLFIRWHERALMNSAENNYKIAKHNNGLDKYTKP